jgi:hypothetical protein
VKSIAHGIVVALLAVRYTPIIHESCGYHYERFQECLFLRK